MGISKVLGFGPRLRQTHLRKFLEENIHQALDNYLEKVPPCEPSHVINYTASEITPLPRKGKQENIISSRVTPIPVALAVTDAQ